jgi:tetratricopeptide (TPR) repeat protein
MVINGDFINAHKSIDKLLKKIPTSFEFLNLKAHVFLTQGLWDESLKIFNKSNLFHPQIVETIFNIGIAYENLINYEDALINYEKCISLDTNFIPAYIHIINLHIKNYDIDKAFIKIESLLEINLNMEIPYQLSAQCYRLIHKYVEQEKVLQQAIQINPNNSMNYVYLAFIKMWSNNTYEAKKLLQKSLSINPKNTFAIYNLMQIDKNIVFNHDFSLLESILKSSNLNNDDLVYLELCYAQFFHNKDDEKYIYYLSKANERKNRSLQFNKFSMNRFFEKLSNKFNSYNFSNYESNNDNYYPIFILGMPRSGSSLIEQIVIKHPSVDSCGEVDLLNYELTKFVNDENSKNNNLNIISNKYLSFINKITKSKYFVDKLPLNFLWIGYIKKIFPNAKFIITHRDKFDNCFSIFKSFFGDSALPFSYTKDNINYFYSFHMEVIKFWKEIFNTSIFSISYEKIIDNPQDEFLRLFNFLNLEFNHSYLNLSDSKSFIQTASFLQARNKIEKKSSYDKYVKYFPEFT